MEQVRYDVIVVGAGPAGVTAAAGVARAGMSVLLLEAGAFAGAENWSGCVYFAESLLHPEAFGPSAIDNAPYERKVVRRAVGVTDGATLVSLAHQDAATFDHCYTVLRPAFDPHWTTAARALGATVQCGVTVTSLIRRNGRVVGVHTSQGPAYADLTFLAEGDASHLVRYEGLETTSEPGFTQGVKAVYSLSPEQIEARFNLQPGEAAANELLVRNASQGGRTAQLNMAAFVYTNRNSLSVGYAVPLANLAQNFRGKHENLLAYVTGLPGISGYLEGAELSAFGTKLIRTGGVRRSPKMVSDGLVVGGSAAALGIDAPYPNFTGPASATGLYFARAARTLAEHGQTPSAANLTSAYLEPLKTSRYWQDAQSLSHWPDFLESTHTLFGVSIDLTCGAARYLTGRGTVWNKAWQYGRLLRPHLTPKTVGKLMAEGAAMTRAIGASGPLSKALTLGSIGRWAKNSVTLSPHPPKSLSVEILVDGESRDLHSLPWGMRGPVRHLLPALGSALGEVYQNSEIPFSTRMENAVRTVVDAFSLLDILLLGLCKLDLAILAGISAVYDLFRYKVLKVPAAEVLNTSVARDQKALKERRDLDALPDTGAMAARLATNTYLEGSTSHIRVRWPEALNQHTDLNDAAYWSVCPAGVYAIEPAMSGHGTVSVNFENCVKCESCWQADDSGVSWGRHTDHGLVYRPDSAALDMAPAPAPTNAPNRPRFTPVATLPDDMVRQRRHGTVVRDLAALTQHASRALIAFDVAVDNLPMAVDSTRMAWPKRVGSAARQRLRALEAGLNSGQVAHLPASAGLPDSPFAPLTEILEQEVSSLSNHLAQDNLFEAVAVARRIRETVLTPLCATLLVSPPQQPNLSSPCPAPAEPTATEARLREQFNDARVKQWEKDGIGSEDARRLAEQFSALPSATESDPIPGATLDSIRGFSAIHAGVGLLCLSHAAARALGAEHATLADGSDLQWRDPAEGDSSARLTGRLVLVPARLAGALVILHGDHAYTVALDHPGIHRRPVAAGGMHPAGFESLEIDLEIAAEAIQPIPTWFRHFLAHGYGTLALGAGDYMARRALEQAEGRIQFPGQMQDVAGRDSIAKFGAVKALVARTLSWRQLLLGLLDRPQPELSGRSLLIPAVASMGFSPKDGRMGYDAGQVFGGTGYSEDEKMSRCYRDSAVFGHLTPGRGALLQLADWWVTCDTRLADHLTDPDSFASLAAGPLSTALAAWQNASARLDAMTIASTPAREALTLGLAAWPLMTATQVRLEDGSPVEGEVAALELLMDQLMGLLDQAQTEQAAGNGNGQFSLAHFPEWPEQERQPLALSYDELVHRDDPYASGDFLTCAPDATPRFIPEIQLHDPALRETWEHCYEWFLTHCHKAPDDGGYYEHYMERLHTIPPEMLEGFKQNTFFGTVVPKELDGLGWKKIGYYLLVSGAMRHGDASLSLLIMASTSIGTTPALIGLEKELPVVDKELSAFRDDPSRLGEIADALDAIVLSLDQPDPQKLQRDVTALVALVDERMRRSKVVKYLAQNFLITFYGAALAGKRKDFAAFTAGLKEAQTLLQPLADTITLAMDELPRRKRSAQAFLRALGHDAVAAFALTEPTAGSDSGGVTTTAHLHQTTLTRMGDGRYRFEIDGQERFLLDADRIEYNDNNMVYRLQSGELAPIDHSTYDYSNDTGTRTLNALGEALPFHDIAQVRDGDLYPYYEVSGAKMWITNGRCATQFSMYVATDEGVTGLLVDRHAEGLIVGRDEDKMGQQGSPTNELSIDRMRVPRENVIGYEGHGQVNALDTLNVGRCGLAVAGVVMARRQLVEALAEDDPNVLSGLPEAERRRELGEVAARIFATESLCYHLIGRFDNHATTSVRLESAIAKYICSEMLHETLDRIDLLRGPQGQTRDLLLEKMRRDARILNIYEGTNEVQRFLILRELCAMVKIWPVQETPEGHGRDVDLARWKETLRRTVGEAVATLGDAVWQDAAMQTAFFPLAEMAGELYLLDTSIYRLGWLHDHRDILGAGYTDATIATGERAVTQCLGQLQRRFNQYNRGRDAALTSHYPIEAVVADAAMEDHHMAAPELAPLTRAITITCLLRPQAIPAPQPRLRPDGGLAERLWQAAPSDAHGLSQALALKAAARAAVQVNVIACGGSHGEALLRDALGAGADRATLIDLDPACSPAEWATALQERPELAANILLCGADDAGVAAPLAAFMAGRLSRPLVSGAQFSACADRGVATLDGTPLNDDCVIQVTGTGQTLRPDLSAMARAHMAPIERLDAIADTDPLRFVALETIVSDAPVAQDVNAAAKLIGNLAEQAKQQAAQPFIGEWQKRNLRTGDVVWAMAQGHEAHAATAFRAARTLADGLGLPAYALVSGSEDGIRQLAGAARDAGLAICFGIDTEGAALSDHGMGTLLGAVVAAKDRSGSPTRVIAPHGWEAALGQLAGQQEHAPATLGQVSAISAIEGYTQLHRTAYAGRLQAISRYDHHRSLWFTVAEGATFSGGEIDPNFALDRPGDRRFTHNDLDLDFRMPQPSLKGAEVIVDMGLGAGTPEGLALANELLAALDALNLKPHLGATRKITQGLGMLPLDAQIGQTGISVNPRLIIALGISGAPQHVDYIGGHAQVLAFNKDAEAPLMQLERPGCTVHPIVGDLFETVPQLIAALKQLQG